MPAITAERLAAATARLSGQPAAPPSATARASGSPDPYTRYFLRLDAELAGKSRQYARRFLEVQRTKFIADYGRFTEDVDAGRARPMENATDYTTIIAELGARLAREMRS